MKNLLFLIIALISFSAISSPVVAQQSIKFIDGIDLKQDNFEYTASANPASELIKTPIEKKVKISALAPVKFATEQCKKLQFKYAQLMDIDIEDIANLTMFHFIEEWWRTGYRYGGSSKKGIDCSALTGLLLSTVYGVVLPRTAREQFSRSSKISREEIKEGDLVFFNTRGGVSHVGVYLANDYFVHASVSSGVTISNLNDSYYSRKYIGAGRVISEN